MNRIEVFIKDSNGTYVSVKGRANVVNTTTSLLLDEALDESRIVLKNSSIANYKPLTRVRVDHYEDETLVDSDFFIIGNPKTDEYPIKKD